MTVDIVFLLFVAAALVVFWRLPAPHAAWVVFLGGWVLLPVGHHPAGSSEAGFPYWITGLVVPSDMLVTKAWVAPVAALLGALGFDRATLARWRPTWADLPMVLWCAWPAVQSLVIADTRPPGALASLYLAGAWGAPWLLGRLYAASPDGQRIFVKALVWSAVACLPIALVEGVFGSVLYPLVDQPHPFRNDGIARYVGSRPIGLFEHGNQYGLWVCLGALAALWLWKALPNGREGRVHCVLAVVATALALAAQSVGGILLLGLGAAGLSFARVIRLRRVVLVAVSTLVLGGAVYVSGAVPIAKLGASGPGHRVIDAFRSVGRGSFLWRISQDQKLLPTAMARPVVGSGAWDWWQPLGIRPWGLSILLLGQYGLIGVALAYAAWLWPALRVAWQVPLATGWQAHGAPLLLAALVVLSLIDALMNTFVYFPALAAAGAIALQGARE